MFWTGRDQDVLVNLDWCSEEDAANLVAADGRIRECRFDGITINGLWPLCCDVVQQSASVAQLTSIEQNGVSYCGAQDVFP